MDLFRDSKDRVRRAKLHRESFADHWNALIEKDALDLLVECHPDKTGYLKFRRRSPYVSDLALELGEFFYQLRSALDGLVFAAIRHKAGNPHPVPHENSLYFPIEMGVKDFNKRAKYLGPLPEQLRFWIKRVQPCFASENTDEAISQISRLLELLHDCARKDRHRRLTILAPYGRELSITMAFTPHVEIEFMEGVSCNLFENEGILAQFRLAKYVPGLKVDLEGELVLDVVLEKIEFSKGQFTEALDSIGRVVEYTISQFEAHFLA